METEMFVEGKEKYRGRSQKGAERGFEVFRNDLKRLR